MDSAIDVKTTAGLALAACVILRQGACIDALKGTREMLSCVLVNSSRVLGFERSDCTLKPPLTMMRSDAPPNFWEREYAEFPARYLLILNYVFRKMLTTAVQVTGSCSCNLATTSSAWIRKFGRLSGDK